MFIKSNVYWRTYSYLRSTGGPIATADPLVDLLLLKVHWRTFSHWRSTGGPIATAGPLADRSHWRSIGVPIAILWIYSNRKTVKFIIAAYNEHLFGDYLTYSW